MTQFSSEDADTFMQKMSSVLDEIHAPACIAMSYGEDKFYIENSLMAELESSEKDIAFAGLNVAMVNGLLNTTNE